jgi:hypothetical protein
MCVDFRFWRYDTGIFHMCTRRMLYIINFHCDRQFTRNVCRSSMPMMCIVHLFSPRLYCRMYCMFFSADNTIHPKIVYHHTRGTTVPQRWIIPVHCTEFPVLFLLRKGWTRCKYFSRVLLNMYVSVKSLPYMVNIIIIDDLEILPAL